MAYMDNSFQNVITTTRVDITFEMTSTHPDALMKTLSKNQIWYSTERNQMYQVYDIRNTQGKSGLIILLRDYDVLTKAIVDAKKITYVLMDDFFDVSRKFVITASSYPVCINYTRMFNYTFVCDGPSF
jgi:hypothetical protein